MNTYLIISIALGTLLGVFFGRRTINKKSEEYFQERKKELKRFFASKSKSIELDIESFRKEMSKIKNNALNDLPEKVAIAEKRLDKLENTLETLIVIIINSNQFGSIDDARLAYQRLVKRDEKEV